MLLKYLELSGFKSFPDRTRVEFGKGLTAVVGPNGSGKSNISDAVRWVLGEQSSKTLRGEKMEDVVFSGTKTRKAQGFAEVSLVIDNTDRTLEVDSDEVIVTRRYDRSGESEYLLNRSVVRLRDIQEIFMDTGLGKDGYSLVGQGRIAEIVQSKSTQRREIFEEAAGIAKFRYRKNEAERNLAKAEENLARLHDILSELESRLAPLKEQSEKAKLFIELAEQKKSLEISIWVQTIEQSNRALKDHSDKLLICTQKRESLDTQIEEAERKINAAFERMQSCLVEMEALRNERSSLTETVSEHNASIAVCENDIRHNEERIKQMEQEIALLNENTDAARSMLLQKQAAADALEQEAAALTEKARHFEASYTELTGQVQKLQAAESDGLSALQALNVEKTTAHMEAVAAADSLSQLLADTERRRNAAAALQEDVKQYKSQIGTAQALIETINDKMLSMKNIQDGLRLKLEGREKKLSALAQEEAKLSSQISERTQKQKLLSAMEQSLDGYAYSVKEILKRAKSGVLSGICGTVSQIIRTDDVYATAIETALASSMQNLVTETEADAKAAIRLLQKENLGRATFLPISSVKGTRLSGDGFEQYAGYVGLAAELVSFDAPYRGIVDFLLGRVVVAEDLDAAVQIAKRFQYKFRVVTLDGQVVNAGGSMTGGSRNKSAGLLSRKNEISALSRKIAALTQEKAVLASSIQSIRQDTARLQAELTASDAELITMNEDKIRAESEKQRLQELLAKTDGQIADVQADESRRTVRERSLKESIASAQENEKTVSEKIAQREETLSEVRRQQQEISNRRMEADQLIRALSDQRAALSQKQALLSQEMQMVKERVESGSGDAIKRQEDCTALKKQNTQIYVQIDSLKADVQHMQERFDAIAAELEFLAQRRRNAEAESEACRREERVLSEQRERIMSEAARLEERCAQLQRSYDERIAKLWEEYELTKSEAMKLAKPIEDLTRANSALMTLRTKIRALGSVNVDAIEEYREVSDRYTFLTRQTKDAEQSRAELLRLIDDLTSQMQSIFAENFEQINTHFKRIFVELFGGGHAELKMTDPSDVLETGIEIFVEPPGKVIKNLSALSGGEQAFVAIAIYFAIIKVHPAPFCILDEIEAALDDVNVDKYAAYLRSLSDKTQFIAITHRRGTMEAADVLYGVTMQEEGVSKLLKMQVNDTGVANLLEQRQ